MSAAALLPRAIGEALPLPSTAPRAARLTVTLLMGALVAMGAATAIANWHLTDLKAYLAAAHLIASGGNPFDVLLWEGGLPYRYHYSPWLAALMVPLSALPFGAVGTAWSAVLIGAGALALMPLVRSFGWKGLPLVLLMLFLLLNLFAEGNVQPLLLAGLVWSLERRAGPVMIGVAASLKLVPILLALVYVGRGEWRRAAVACLVTGVLLSPTLLFEVTPTAVETGGTGLFTAAPVLWAASAGASAAGALALARTKFGWLAAATSTILALPRLLIFDVTNLLAAVPESRTGTAGLDSERGPTANR